MALRGKKNADRRFIHIKTRSVKVSGISKARYHELFPVDHPQKVKIRKTDYLSLLKISEENQKPLRKANNEARRRKWRMKGRLRTRYKST